MGSDNEWGLPAQMQIWELNIDAETEIISVRYKIVTTTPTGKEDVRVDKIYTRFNSRTTDTPTPFNGFKTVTQDNLKFDELRESQVGQMITGMLGLDVEAFDGTPESIAQKIYTDPIPVEPE